jgi:MoxR-like ATPase
MVSKTQQIITEVRKVVLGKDDVIVKTLMTLLSKGHILIEDIPGVGKTTLALAFSKALSLEYKRMQFTPDVMPSDITGFSVYQKEVGELVYKPGAAICNLFLADEINRTSSKTQSALLEVMEEGGVTVDGVTHRVPQPYTVIATQNPAGSAGTQLLPESQLDRFMVRLTIGYPDQQSEIAMMKGRKEADPMDGVQAVANAEEIIGMQDAVAKVFVSDAVYTYIADLVALSRASEELSLGVSPRGTLAVVKMAKSCAYLCGRDYVIPDDVKRVFADVCSHRVVTSKKARIAGISSNQVMDNLLAVCRIPAV